MRAVADRPHRSLLLAGTLLACGAWDGPANAGVIAQCGQPVCSSSFSIFLQGSSTEAGGGQINYSATTGNVWLDLDTADIRGGGTVMRDGANNPTGITWSTGNGASVSVNVSGNADPILGFSVGTTTGAASVTVGFVFDLPIALAGQILADARVAYSLTSLSEAGATISPTAGKIVDAFDLDTVGATNPDIDKGVDVGDAFSVAAFGNSGSPSYSATSFFTLAPTYDVMRVTVNYSLTPNSLAGVTGFVRQVVVPLPAALPLLLVGLVGLGTAARRRVEP